MRQQRPALIAGRARSRTVQRTVRRRSHPLSEQPQSRHLPEQYPSQAWRRRNHRQERFRPGPRPQPLPARRREPANRCRSCRRGLHRDRRCRRPYRCRRTRADAGSWYRGWPGSGRCRGRLRRILPRRGRPVRADRRAAPGFQSNAPGRRTARRAVRSRADGRASGRRRRRNPTQPGRRARP